MNYETPANQLINTVVVTELPNVQPTSDGAPYATHSGVLEIGGVGLEVFVLNDGRRVFAGEGIEVLVAALTGGDNLIDAETMLHFWDSIPDEFKDPQNYWHRAASEWLATGTMRMLMKEAMRTENLAYIMYKLRNSSAQLEHKVAGTAFWFSIWFDRYDEDAIPSPQ